MKKRIYLDNNASTPIHPEIIKNYKKNLALYGNPSSLHQEGRKARAAIEKAREDIAHIINANPEQLIFTSSGCESNSQILQSLCKNTLADQLLYEASAHSSIRYTANYLSQNNIETKSIEVDQLGHINQHVLKNKVTKKSLLSFLWANNETGTIQHVSELINDTYPAPILYHCDAVQALGKVPIDCHKSNLDFLSFSSHKIYAPKGTGLIYCKDINQLKPLIQGPSHEQGLRPGTENIAGIIAFAQALQLLQDMDMSHIKTYKEKLLNNLQNNLPQLIHIGDPINCLSNTLCLSFPHMNGHNLAISLDLEGIAVSTGSACSVGAIEASPVLKAMGIDENINKSSIRISLGYFTTENDIDTTIQTITKIVKKHRS
ncbi:MAG: cysteine desulfurase family protein [bacterium]